MVNIFAFGTGNLVSPLSTGNTDSYTYGKSDNNTLNGGGEDDDRGSGR